MTEQKKSIIRVSDELLQTLLAFRTQHPAFTFSLRSRDSGTSEEERLSNGQWFQGSDYICVPPFRVGDGTRRVKTFGFILEFDVAGRITCNFVQVSFKGISDPREIAFYKDLVKTIAAKYASRDEVVAIKNYSDKAQYQTNFQDFLESTVPRVQGVLERHGLTSKYLEPEEQFLKKLHNIETIRQRLNKQQNSIITMPLNTIFYGPPGTGKTYHSILRAAEIISGRAIANYDEAKMIFSEAKSDQVEFITFHQNYSYEDFIQGLKPDTDPLSSGLKFQKRDGIFKQIADRALANLKASMAPQITLEPTFQEVFDDFFRPLIDETGTIKVIMETKTYSYEITAYNEDQNNFSFKKQSGGTSHTLYVPTLKLFFEQPDHDHIQGLKYYYRPLAKAMRERAASMKKTIKGEERKRYVLVIDEINRANMSRVFGELITLLEEDKRWGNKYQMEVRLPSNDVFTVPNNLHLIGTMNTADKSIALLDIALRRRFQFEPMYPQLELKEVQYPDVLEAINAQILAKKGADFLIGHSYFMSEEKHSFNIAQAFNTKVIPLLNEYFYTAKSGTVQQIVESAIKGMAWLRLERDKYQQLKMTVIDGTV